jgi:hypothetical protein
VRLGGACGDLTVSLPDMVEVEQPVPRGNRLDAEPSVSQDAPVEALLWLRAHAAILGIERSFSPQAET